jgi:hypothetical protein
MSEAQGAACHCYFRGGRDAAGKGGTIRANRIAMRASTHVMTRREQMMSGMHFIKNLIMKGAYAGAIIAFLSGYFYISHVSAEAANIEGAWVSKSAVCSNIFSKSKNGAILFKENSDAFGSGFIINNGSIRGKVLSCKIIRRNHEKDLIHLLASCSSDVMLDTIQFSLRMIGDDRLVRIFPGIPELEYTYERCPI